MRNKPFRAKLNIPNSAANPVSDVGLVKGSTEAGALVTAAGDLRRVRPDTPRVPWSKIHVDRQYARWVGSRMLPAHGQMLAALAYHRVLTTEQFERAFFRSRATAEHWLRWAERERLIFRFPAPASTLETAFPYLERGNRAYAIDWNGYYLLHECDPDAIAGWSYRTVARVTATLAHKLQVNEVWSYFMAAARAAHLSSMGIRPGLDRIIDLERAPLHPVLALGCASEPTHKPCSARRDLSATTARNRLNRLVRPDAALLLHIKDPGALLIGPDSSTSYYIFAMSQALNATVQDTSWTYAYIPDTLPVAVLQELERDGTSTFRFCCLELETGSHDAKATVEKIKAYVRLYSQPHVWQPEYGSRFPTIVVVVPHSAQLPRQVELWRQHWPMQTAYSVVITSLDLLDLAYQAGRCDGPGAMLRYACYYDGSRAGGADPVPFADAFSITGLPGSLQAS